MLANLINIDSLEEIEVEVDFEDLKLQSTIKGLNISGLSFFNQYQNLIIYGYKKQIRRSI